MVFTNLAIVSHTYVANFHMKILLITYKQSLNYKLFKRLFQKSYLPEKCTKNSFVLNKNKKRWQAYFSIPLLSLYTEKKIVLTTVYSFEYIYVMSCKL